MLALKITKIGNSSGLLLPKEAMAKLRVEQGDTVYLKGERTHQTFENAQQVWNGIGQHHFEQAFSLPTAVDAQGAQATYEWGILTLRLAKAQHARAHTIKVGAGSRQEPHVLEQAGSST